ncbi:MAG: signal peptidase I [Aeromicrobium sp.]|uniref:signal peptidase I n=1 Tax=Aeromicrobium sp. TaxID=1871063 RepID=UPI0039E463EA
MRRAGYWIAEAALWTGAVLGTLSLLAALLALSGAVRPLVFTSGSMAPEIPTGSLGFSRPVSASDVAVGDVVNVTRGDGQQVTHRVVGVEPDGSAVRLTLKGDANRTPDAETYVVTGAHRVFFDVPWLGRVATELKNPLVSLTLVAFLAALIVSPLMLRGRRRRDGRGRRRAVRHSGAHAAAVLAVVASLAAAHSVTPTMAGFTDTSVLAAGSLTAGSVTKPAETSPKCAVSNGLVTKTLTTYWTAATTPTTLTYTAVVRETGTSLTVTSSGTTRSAKVTNGLLDLTNLLGATLHIDVTATLPGTNWTATSTRTFTVAALTAYLACGAWS